MDRLGWKNLHRAKVGGSKPLDASQRRGSADWHPGQSAGDTDFLGSRDVPGDPILLPDCHGIAVIGDLRFKSIGSVVDRFLKTRMEFCPSLITPSSGTRTNSHPQAERSACRTACGLEAAIFRSALAPPCPVVKHLRESGQVSHFNNLRVRACGDGASFNS